MTNSTSGEILEVLEVLSMKLEGGKRHERSFEWHTNQQSNNCDRFLSVVHLLK